MAIKNFKKSEPEKMLDIVQKRLKLGEKKIKLLVQSFSVTEDEGMTRIYSAFTPEIAK